jgi:hypothetical protein
VLLLVEQRLIDHKRALEVGVFEESAAGMARQESETINFNGGIIGNPPIL